jgi:hypothetical protein
LRVDADVRGDAEFDISGTSKVETKLKAVDVKYSASGVSSAQISGEARGLTIRLSGASNIQAEDFMVERAMVDTSGAGVVSLHVTNELQVHSSGASSVSYKGSPSVTGNNSGASRIRSI